MTETAPMLEPPKAAPRTAHIKYLDGLRGCSALYVVLFHLYGNNPVPSAHRWIRVVTGWTHWGEYAVDVFIVLSGYSLMLPIARSDANRLRGGFAGYIKRRAWRILPPYYAALIIGLALCFVVPAERLALHPGALSLGSVLSHLLLVHNIKAPWARSIDPPMWSVATEWQIYFLFPSLLLPAWRRFGNAAVIILGFSIGMLPIFLSRGRWFWWASPWFLGLFCLGMVGAVQAHPGPARTRKSMSRRSSAGWLTACFFGLLCFVSVYLPADVKRYPYLMDSLVGAVTVLFLAYCAQQDKARISNGGTAMALRILESRTAVWLGMVSYSLYLVHAIVMIYLCDPVSSFVAAAIPGEPPLAFVAQAAFNLFSVLVISYVFYLFFEKPFVAIRAS